jgi:hypothetical protein
VRSWDGQAVSFAHPDGEPSEDWTYDDAQNIMRALVGDVFDGEPIPFHITFELDGDPGDVRIRPRRYFIKCERGHVELEPLLLSYLGTFGMSSVFHQNRSAPNGVAGPSTAISNRRTIA